MCGIAGTIHLLTTDQEQAAILHGIGHRGPDDQGTFSAGHTWLANTRLAIQDLSAHGHQPMQSADGRYTIVYNGELYNHWDIRKKLAAKGYPFTSGTDTETLLCAFIEWGADCLQQLEGIFVFAVHDRETDELFIARDPLGVKPLYYYQRDAHFAFASELKALLSIQALDRTLRPEAFYYYLLLLYQPGTSTPFRHFHKLLPGHFIRIRNGAVTTRQYYQVPFNGNYDLQASRESWIDRLDNALNKTVQAQLLSDAPVGFFLSGGLDSSLIAAIAQRQYPDKHFPAFTIDTGQALSREGFEDDLPFARIVAQHTGLQLQEVPGQMNIAAALDAMVWQLDEPQADPAALHVRHIAAAAKAQGIKVLLGGTGADDVFSGYRRHQALHYEAYTRLIPPALSRPAASLLKALGKANAARRLSKLTSRTGTALQQRIATHFWIAPDRLQSLFHNDLRSSLPAPYTYFEQLTATIPGEQDPLNQMLYWEQRTFLPDHNLNYTDKMSMAEGVEARVPYLDTQLVALAAQIPPALKMQGTETKYLLREVARRYLPESIIRRKKTGFAAPVRQWMQHDLKGLLRERLLSGDLERWNIFNPGAVAQMIDNNTFGRTDDAYTLFSLLAIESWLRQFAAK